MLSKRRRLVGKAVFVKVNLPTYSEFLSPSFEINILSIALHQTDSRRRNSYILAGNNSLATMLE